MRTMSFLLALAFASPAHAVPFLLQQQGRLLDAVDQPLTGSRPVTFALYDDDTAGNLLWTETVDVTFADGYFSVTLGQTNAITEAEIEEPEIWLGLTIATEELLPRQRLVSVPYAVRSGTAESLVGGHVDATSIAVGGVPVVDAGGAWVGAPPPDTLSGLTCNTGDLPQKSAGGWVCVPGSTFATTRLDWTDIDNRPAGLDDGDDDTRLTEAEVDAYVANDDYLTAAAADALYVEEGQPDSVDSSMIASGAVTSADLAAGAVGMRELAPTTGFGMLYDNTGPMANPAILYAVSFTPAVSGACLVTSETEINAASGIGGAVSSIAIKRGAGTDGFDMTLYTYFPPLAASEKITLAKTRIIPVTAGEQIQLGCYVQGAANASYLGCYTTYVCW